MLFYNARYYDPRLGRFISPDRIVPDPGYSQSFNRYMYVLGNPINYNDPSGFTSDDGPGPSTAPAAEGMHQPAPGYAGDRGSGGNYILTEDGVYWSGTGYAIRYCYTAGGQTVNKGGIEVGHGGEVSDKDQGGEDGDECVRGSGNGSSIDNPFLGEANYKTGNNGYFAFTFISSLIAHFGVAVIPFAQGTNYRVTSRWGYRKNPKKSGSGFHIGVDFGAEEGTPVYATESGVADLGFDSGKGKKYGNYIRIYNKDNFRIYGHLSSFNIVQGQEVNIGDLIGFVGSTGNSTGPHLHYGVFQDGRWRDPLSLSH